MWYSKVSYRLYGWQKQSELLPNLMDRYKCEREYLTSPNDVGMQKEHEMQRQTNIGYSVGGSS